MADQSYVKKLLAISRKYELERKSNINLQETHSAFEGTPRKHPYDKNVFILVTNPFSNKQFYEFSLDSIGTIEELGTITSDTGESALKIRVWIRKGKTALKSEPFTVE